MDKLVKQRALDYADALLAVYLAPTGDANRVPEERKTARKRLEQAHLLLSLAVQAVALRQ